LTGFPCIFRGGITLPPDEVVMLTIEHSLLKDTFDLILLLDGGAVERNVRIDEGVGWEVEQRRIKKCALVKCDINALHDHVFAGKPKTPAFASFRVADQHGLVCGWG